MPSILRHSTNGHGLAAERAGEQALQGFDLVPPPRLRRLHDTRLEPTHVPVGVVPVDLAPVRRRVGDELFNPQCKVAPPFTKWRGDLQSRGEA